MHISLVPFRTLADLALECFVIPVLELEVLGPTLSAEVVCEFVASGITTVKFASNQVREQPVQRCKVHAKR